MKHLLILLFTCCFLNQNAQLKPEIKEVKRYNSLGEKQGFKIILPNRELSKVEKLNKEILKAQNAEIVKPTKGSNEQIFKKFYLSGMEQPLMLIAVVEQEGKNVGWTGYFFNEKDSTTLDNRIATDRFIVSIFNNSMFSLYTDSIYFQEKNIKGTNGLLKDKSKEVDKNLKLINKLKDKIRNAELEIEKSNSMIASLTPQLSNLTTAKTEMQAKLNAAENELNKTKDVESEIKEMLSKSKKQSKNLVELEKDPPANANLIIAQKNDLASLAISIEKRQREFTSIYALAKSALKAAGKDAESAESTFKEAEKNIKISNKTIADANQDITKARKEIEENQKQIDQFIATEKSKGEEAVKVQELILEQLKVIQNLYK